MLKSKLAILVLALGAAPLFADVELQTSINDVFNRGSAELTGSISMTVNDDDFVNASTAEPIYIRVTPDHGSRLAETLVDQGLDTLDYKSQPIYLAMELVSVGAALEIAALTETTSIVRWVAGESAFWIRVQSSSDTWIRTAGGGTIFGPNEDAKVSWTLGISARSSADDNGDNVKSNLPFNTRNAATVGGDEDATSTLLCVNLETSSLDTDGIESLLRYDIISFDYRSDLGGGFYSGQAGNPNGIDFTNDFNIARGKSRNCSVTVGGYKGEQPDNVKLCVPAAVGNGGIDGYVKAQNVITFTISCDRGGSLLDTDLFNGSFVSFDAGGRGYGFLDGGGTATFGSVNSEGVFSPSGTGSGLVYLTNNLSGDLYDDLDIVWNGGTQSLDSYTVTIQVCTYYYYSSPAVDIVLDWSVTLVNHDGAEDSAPYEGADQHRRCDPSEFVIHTDTWDFGSYVPCSGDDAVIFFPYVPKLNDPVDPPTFWVGLSYVNQGNVSFTEGNVSIQIYDEDGTNYTNTDALPALPVQNQMTWLLWDNLGVVELRGAGGNNSGITTTFSPAGMGGTRASMFITGSFDAEFEEDTDGGDLDGYLLIGSLANNSVDGAYLPRNFDPKTDNQEGDLPIRRNKRANSGKVSITSTSPATYGFSNGHVNRK